MKISVYSRINYPESVGDCCNLLIDEEGIEYINNITLIIGIEDYSPFWLGGNRKRFLAGTDFEIYGWWFKTDFVRDFLNLEIPDLKESND